ncbi:MAG: OmpA family protein [Proteobacteria bacterium]|nr:OmpA family protein [Pseudomonadota bacterium]
MNCMSRVFVIALVSLVCSGCVTRNKHAATIATWEDKVAECHADRARLDTEMQSRVAAKDQEIAGVRGDLAQAQAGAASQEAALKADLRASREEIAALRAHRAKIEANLAQYRKLRDAFRKMISAGELRVYKRRGRIMVALPSSVLFPSGKATLSPGGEKALAAVAGVLSKLPNRRFLVAGHTDNVPIKSAGFADNWDLSVARATVVTRFLVGNGMAPRNLAAAGYGQFDSVRKNNSPENRRRNRRIEIILMPNIDELPALPD